MSRRDRVTIADVARAAGVSTGTVSRVLSSRSNSAKISQPTQRHVRDVAEKLGYKPNMIASALRTQRTGVIGAIVRDINDPFLSLLARELQKVAHAAGIELLLGHAEYDPQTAERQLNLMRTWFDGLLIIGDMLGLQAAISLLDQNETPSVALANGSTGHGSSPLVSIDDALGTALGLEYLYSLGHRRIAFIGNTDYAGIRTRWNTFQRFVADKNLDWTDAYFQSCRMTHAAAASCTEHLLRLPIPPTAIFCMTDMLALAAASTAWRLGWRVPEALSILGFDDIEEVSTSFPPLTTIRQPVHEMARESFDLLMHLVEGRPIEDKPLPVVIEPRLIIRESCAPPVVHDRRPE